MKSAQSVERASPLARSDSELELIYVTLDVLTLLMLQYIYCVQFSFDNAFSHCENKHYSI